MIGFGRPTAVKTFMRNNDKQIQARKGRQASMQPVTAQPHCVACLKIPLFVLCVLAILALGAAPALATTEGPGWELTASTVPTYLPPSGKGTLNIRVYNVGAAASHGTVTVTDTLPAGVTATRAGNYEGTGAEQGPGGGEDPRLESELWECTGNGPGGAVMGASVVTCTNKEAPGPKGLSLAEFDGGGGAPSTETPKPGVDLNEQPPVAIAVDAGAEASGLVNHVTIAGGGAPTPASTQDPITISSATPGFGFVGWDGWMSNADGTLDTQAGSHPYEATFSFDLAQALVRNKAGEVVSPGTGVADGEARDIEVALPPGLVVNPAAVPQCTRGQLDNETCPQGSMVGTSTVYLSESGSVGNGLGMQVFNLVPPPGVPAELGFNFGGILTFLDGSVRSGGNYGITSHIDRIPQRAIEGSVVTLWNVPGEASHDPWRVGKVGGCPPETITTRQTEGSVYESCLAPQSPSTKPFLTLETACGSPGPTTIRANTWQDETVEAKDEYELHDSNGNATEYAGCEHLQFAPLITTSPDTAKADTPAGLTVEVKPPIGGLEQQEGLSTSDIQDTSVTLPEGFVINPGQAAGLQACGPAEDGLTTTVEKAEGKENDDPPSCPGASKVGTVAITTPVLAHNLEGDVYVLQSNPPELKLLVAASGEGVNIKLVGVVHLNEQTGQITTKFEGTPELPFTDFKLSFSGGAQAALDTPTQCGSYEATADFTPWSHPFLSDFDTNAAFSLTEGPGGTACPGNPMGFSPTLTAGSTTDQAGGFTDFSLLLQRGDGQQRIEKLSFKAPAGLSGMLSSVPLCGEAQANAGTCPAASHIGHAVVSSGPGPYPLVLPQPGDPELPIYLTGPYGGAPFGLSIVTPVLAGPFNLGTIVTRAKIEVDPHTAQITVTTNPLPQVVAGVPTDLRSIDAVIDRPGFMFNPTNCNAQSFSGTATGTPPPGAGGSGATAAISSPFGVGSCRSLEFKPKFAVSTSGKTSKANGASLTAKVSYPTAAQGTQSNITRVKVDLPKQLPSRLTTLQKACTNAQFEANPAGCPAASIIGHAVVHTALLPVPLTGPAYFVSHGGEAFPSLIMVLQGDGVSVDLVGTTFISKAGITSSTFRTVPDVPFSTFELTLPEGKYSALAANLPGKVKGSFCGQTLAMPTEFLAQNGLKINASTKLAVSGCAKKKAATRAQKLTAALKACNKKAKDKRASCETTARHRYGPAGVKKKQK
jgi:hypothetical protein